MRGELLQKMQTAHRNTTPMKKYHTVVTSPCDVLEGQTHVTGAAQNVEMTGTLASSTRKVEWRDNQCFVRTSLATSEVDLEKLLHEEAPKGFCILQTLPILRI